VRVPVPPAGGCVGAYPNCSAARSSSGWPVTCGRTPAEPRCGRLTAHTKTQGKGVAWYCDAAHSLQHTRACTCCAQQRTRAKSPEGGRAPTRGDAARRCSSPALQAGRHTQGASA